VLLPKVAIPFFLQNETQVLEIGSDVETASFKNIYGLTKGKLLMPGSAILSTVFKNIKTFHKMH